MSRERNWWKRQGRLVRWFLKLMVVFFLAGGACLFLALKLGERLYDQQLPLYWSSDGKPYAQISVFFGESEEVSKLQVDDFRNQIREQIKELPSKDAAQKEARQKDWKDAYSRFGDMTIERGKTSVEVTAYGCGGYFFLFHPLTMLSGAYFKEEDVMHDRVILDEESAWRLFGSGDVAGMTVTISGKEYRIAGVFSMPESKAFDQARKSRPVCFLPFDTFSKIVDGDSGGGGAGGGSQPPGDGAGGGVTGDGAGGAAAKPGTGGAMPSMGNGAPGSTLGNIACYEALLPNPVSDYARQTAVLAVTGIRLSEDEKGEEALANRKLAFVENSSRFSIPSLWGKLQEFRFQSMRREALSYPYWENAALAMENFCALFLGAAILLLAPSGMTFGVLLWRRFQRRKWTFAYGRSVWEAKIERRRKKAWDKKTAKAAEMEERDEKKDKRF